MKKTINITPSWKVSAEIIILALQNKKLDNKGLENVFYNIRDMAQKLDKANENIKRLECLNGTETDLNKKRHNQ